MPLEGHPMLAGAIDTQLKRSPKIAVLAVLGALEELGTVWQDEGNCQLTVRT